MVTAAIDTTPGRSPGLDQAGLRPGLGNASEEKLVLLSAGVSDMKDKNVSHRDFLRDATCAAIGTISLPYIIPSSALGKAGYVAASNRITVGCIGLGNQGWARLQGFLGKPDAQIIAVCDVHATKRQGTRETV